MIKGLSEYEKYKVMRPLYSKNQEYTKDYIPIIKKENFETDELKTILVANLKNIKSCPNKNESILMMFNYDDILECIWRDPFKYVAKFTAFRAICTPDFSIYPGMNLNDIRNNVYRNRWIGCMLQEKGIKVIPTIQWCDSSTYDICFSGVEEGSIVIISTIGCTENKEIFLPGYKEMMKRIKPELVIVYGKMIDGMYGTFLQFDYTDAFNKKKTPYIQLSLFPIDNIFIRNGGGIVNGK